MESEYYGGDQSDDGGATPVQDERDSGSDVEDEGNEQHSGSENGSVGHHSEEYVGEMTLKGSKTFETASSVLNFKEKGNPEELLM